MHYHSVTSLNGFFVCDHSPFRTNLNLSLEDRVSGYKKVDMCRREPTVHGGKHGMRFKSGFFL